jgi:hypothetical protein
METQWLPVFNETGTRRYVTDVPLDADASRWQCVGCIRVVYGTDKQFWMEAWPSSDFDAPAFHRLVEEMGERLKTRGYTPKDVRATVGGEA